DWTVPREWNIRDAYIQSPSGERVVDFRDSNLHVVGYSTPVRARIDIAELRPHLFSLPDRPDWIPYRTSYYAERWGFCLSHNQLAGLSEQTYDVCIDSSLENGSLTYGDYLLKGQSADEVLISCHVCHPSLCNDNLSGIAVAVAIAQALQARRTRYSYRFLFIPGTIGSITWLAHNRAVLPRVRHGVVLTCLGDTGRSTYKKTRRGDAEIDRAFAYVLRASGAAFDVQDFSPYGYDERQYNSPGFNLPIGCLMRTPHGCFPEYHTSADNLDLVRPAALRDSLEKCLAVIDVLEDNRRYLNCFPYGEPQLGRRGLYGSIGGQSADKQFELALLWVLNQSDGKHTLLDVADRAGLAWATATAAASALQQQGLLAEFGNNARPPATDERGEVPCPTRAAVLGGADQVAVIIGASSGIGQATAQALAARGLRLCLVGRDPERLQQTASRLNSQGLINPYTYDISKEEEVSALVDALARDVSRIDVLVHSAGTIEFGPIATASDEAFDRQWRTNVRGPYALTQGLLPLLRACAGQIVFINSSAGLNAVANAGAYSATKHALKAIADSLRAEVNKDGIRVISVYPGRTASPMQETIHRAEGKPYHPGQLIQPVDVAEVILQALALPRSAELTDVNIRPMRMPLQSR
ncbi:MAG: hypothetical protein QOD74_1640, partial [Variibacter sp.]|nr:hypothetical protein [Variibacter sp.]